MRLHRIFLILCFGGPLLASFLLPLPPADGDAVRAQPYDIPCCMFRSLTGLPCPFCGLTRSFVSLSHGRWREAFLFHLLGPLVYAGFLAGVLAGVISWRRAVDPAAPPAGRSPGFWAAWTVAGIFVAAWIAKFALIPKAYW